MKNAFHESPIDHAKRLAGIVTRWDETEMRAHTKAMGIRPSSDEVFWRMWHKVRTASTLVNNELREASRAWLIAHDSEPWN